MPSKGGRPLVVYSAERVAIITAMTANAHSSNRKIANAINAKPGPVITLQHLSRWMVRNAIVRPPLPIEEMVGTPERVALVLAMRAQKIGHAKILPLINAMPGAQITQVQLRSMGSNARVDLRAKSAKVPGVVLAEPQPATPIRASLADVTAWAEQIRADPEASIEDLNVDRTLRGLLPFDVAGDRAPAWPGAAEHLLRQMWAAGTVTKEIGAKIGVTKNAVVGKARRLHLTARPSPIVTGGAPPDRKHRTMELMSGIRTLPLLPSEEAAFMAGGDHDVVLPFWLVPVRDSNEGTEQQS